MINAAFLVQARQADLRREADEARLARIARKATRPRPIRVIGAALSLIRAWNRREGFGFADGFLGYDGRDRWPCGVQEDHDFAGAGRRSVRLSIGCPRARTQDSSACAYLRPCTGIAR